MPTKKSEDGDFKVDISFIKEDDIKTFKCKHTMPEMLNFIKYIKTTYKEMEKYCLDKPYSN